MTDDKRMGQLKAPLTSELLTAARYRNEPAPWMRDTCDRLYGPCRCGKTHVDAQQMGQPQPLADARLRDDIVQAAVEYAQRNYHEAGVDEAIVRAVNAWLQRPTAAHRTEHGSQHASSPSDSHAAGKCTSDALPRCAACSSLRLPQCPDCGRSVEEPPTANPSPHVEAETREAEANEGLHARCADCGEIPSHRCRKHFVADNERMRIALVRIHRGEQPMHMIAAEALWGGEEPLADVSPPNETAKLANQDPQWIALRLAVEVVLDDLIERGNATEINDEWAGKAVDYLIEARDKPVDFLRKHPRLPGSLLDELYPREERP